MPGFNRKAPGEDYAIDSCPVIIGYENANPPSLISQNRANAMINRIATIDARNRCRPGIIRQVIAANPLIFGGFYQNNQYLFTDGTTLYGYNSGTQVLTSLFGSLPFTSGLAAPTINGCQGGGSAGGLPVFFFNQGAGIYWWDGTAWNTASMPVASPNMSFPVWTTNRLVTARTGTNDLVFSDIGTIPLNWGPLNNDLSVRVTLDTDGKDSITGIAAYQAGVLIAGKRGKLYAVYDQPTNSVANFGVQVISTSIGVAEHNTMAMGSNALFFLSETGQGVYSIGLQPGTSIVGVGSKVSDRITPDIQRINWSAINTARAIVWYDLYILAVPLDGASQPNCLLVYSIALDEWQGLWTGTDQFSNPAFWRVLCQNPSNTTGSELLYAFADGRIGLQTQPLASNAQYFDLSTDGHTQIPITSSILTRGFHWDSTVIPPSQAEQPFNVKFLNQCQPYNIRMRFNQSSAPVDLDLISDLNTITDYRQNLSTTTKKLQLPHDLPWNLDTLGDQYQSINVQPIQPCFELQASIDGTGDWRLQSIDATAQIDRPLTNA
jgi:hypothetical protein